MKKQLFLSAGILLAACVLGLNNPSLVVMNDGTKEETPVLVEKKGLVLPEVKGVTIQANKTLPDAGDKVTLTVTVDNPMQQKVQRVTLNGQELIGKDVGKENSLNYEFIMPKRQNAVIDVKTADVYKINVKEDVASYLTLSGLDSLVAAEGETVSFRPATYAGYWYENVFAVESDVVLTPVKDKVDWYSFTMPAHDVTIGADTGKNLYKVTITGDTVTEGEEKIKTWTITGGVDSGEFYEYGSELRFRFYYTEAGAKYRPTTARVDGNPIDLGEDGFYHYTMPAYDITISCDYEIWYRNVFVTDNTELYNATLKTVIDDKEVDVTESNVIAGQKIRVYLKETGNTAKAKPVIKLKEGSNLESLSSSNKTITYNEEGYYEFDTPSANYISVVLTDEESPIKGTELVGEYDTGYKFSSSGNYMAKITDDSEFYITNSSVYPGSTPTYSSSPDKITKDPTVKNKFAVGSYSSRSLYFNKEDAILYKGSSDYTLYAKGKGGIVPSTSTEKHTYAYELEEGFSTVMAYFHMECANGEIISCLFDIENSIVYWGATATVKKGENGMKKDDVVEIRDAQGNYLKTFTVSSISSTYTHTVVETVLDGNQGVYVSETDITAGDLNITGFGEATLGHANSTYTIERDNVVVLTINGKNRYYQINKEAYTYREVDDGLAGTFNSEELGLTLVLDGFGAGTLGEEEITYTKNSATMVEVTSSAGTVKYLLDLTNLTFSEPFYITKADYDYTFVDDGAGNLVSNNKKQKSTKAVYQFVALKKMTISFDYKIYSENSDKFYIDLINSSEEKTKILSGVGGTVTDKLKETTLKRGEILELRYEKDISVDTGDDCVTISNIITKDVSNIPDGFEGEYTGEDGIIIFDGFGVATLQDNSFEYNIDSENSASFTSGNYAYIFNKTDKTYTKNAFIVSTNFEYTFQLNDANQLVSNNKDIDSTSAIMTITVFGDVTISFDYFVSSESYGDYFKAYINDSQKISIAGTTNTDFTTQTLELKAGDTLKFVYIKDYNTSKGDDRATIANLKIGDVYYCQDK